MANKVITLNTKNRRLMIHETVTSYLFLAPFLLFFVMFVLYPMFMCVYTSFFDATMGREDVFIGFANYKTLFNDPVFWTALKNTMVIVIVSVPITCIFSLWVATVISKMPVVAISVFCLHLLPACCHRFCRCHRRMEVDVQQLLRNFQLSGPEHGSDR